MKKLLPVAYTIVALFSAVPVHAARSLRNPLGTSDPNELIANVIRTFLGVIGGIALIFFIYGGFMMLISAGSSDRIQKGRDTLMWATIGLIFIFGSYGIVEAVFQALAGESIV